MTHTLIPVNKPTSAQADGDVNDPEEFHRLEPDKQAALVDWILHVLAPAKRVFPNSSYVMKHDFEREPDGFYVRNGAFKGAMLAAGFLPMDQAALNWHFRVKPVKGLSRRERQQKGLIGRGWLVRKR